MAGGGSILWIRLVFVLYYSELEGFMLVVRQGQTLYNIPTDQIDPMRWQTPPTQQIQFQQPTVGKVITDVLGAVAVVGLGFAAGAAIGELLFGQQERVLHCSDCGRSGHTARNCPVTGQRVALRKEKTGNCGCCGRRFRSTQLHHYAGRGLERGKEMCLPCHLQCGHDGNWKLGPFNPRYCRLDT
jgi:hypothetical protein